MADNGVVLVTGATGYIGGRLTPKLVQRGQRVRVLVRNADRIRARPWSDQVEVAVGDVLDPETLPAAMAGVDCAYYLIHSMSGGAGFHDLDLTAARNFATAAQQAGVRRIIYLGGLGDANTDLSQHLRSRQETGQALRVTGVPVTEFRAAVIVGAGERLIRNDPLLGGTPAGDDLSEMGLFASAANRHRGPIGVPRAGHDDAGKRRTRSLRLVGRMSPPTRT